MIISIKLWVLVGFCLFLLNTGIYAGFPKRDPKTCVLPKTLHFKNQVELPTLSDQHETKQGELGTCYAFSAYFMLQHHYLKVNHLDPSSTENISIVDLIGIAKEGDLCNPSTGMPFQALQKVKDNDYSICLDHFEGGEGDYKRILRSDFFENQSCFHEKHFEEVIAWVEAMACPPLKNLLKDESRNEEFREYLNLCLSQPSTAPHRLLFGAGCRKKIQIPPYNVHILDKGPNDDAVSFENKKSKRIIETLDLGFPVGLNTGAHAIAASGYRSACCHTPEGIPDSLNEDCVLEVKLQDSEANESDRADPWFLAAPVFRNAPTLNYILPCSEGGGGIWEECTSSIQGAKYEQLRKLVQAGNVASVLSVLEDDRIDPRIFLLPICTYVS